MEDSLTCLALHLDAGPTADHEAQVEETRRFRQHLSAMDFVKVEPGPPGAKGDLVTLSALAVTLAPVALKSLLSMLQDWLARRKNATVTVKIGDEMLTVTGTPSKEQRTVIASFLARHGTDEP